MNPPTLVGGGSVCSSHHRALHDGLLTITGKAPNVEVRWTRETESSPHVGRARDDGSKATAKAEKYEQGRPHVGPTPEPDKDIAAGPGPRNTTAGTARTAFEAVAIRNDANQALVQLGFKRHEARAALDAACAGVGPDATLEQLVVEALRHCPKPRG